MKEERACYLVGPADYDEWVRWCAVEYAEFAKRTDVVRGNVPKAPGHKKGKTPPRKKKAA